MNKAQRTILNILWTRKAIKNTPTFLVDFLGFCKDKRIIYKTANGLKVVCRSWTNDKSELVVIFANKGYPKELFPNNFMPTVLDIGAHVGLFSLYLSQELKQNNPRIYAVEPSNINFSYLKQNVQMNCFKNILTFNLAISDYRGIGYLKQGKNYDDFSLEKNTNIFSQRCPVLTMESFCEANGIKAIDLLKIDCEGAEHQIFKRKETIRFLKKRVKNILVEVHNIDGTRNMNSFRENIIKNNFGIRAVMLGTVLFIKNLNFSQ